MARSLALLEEDPPTPSMRRALALETYAECRTLGHAWERFTPTDKKRPRYGVLLSLRCMRCPTERHDIAKRMDGSVLDRDYDYPDDYRMSAEQSLTRDQWRKVLIKQIDGPSNVTRITTARGKTRRR